jgi:hypothetical protein
MTTPSFRFSTRWVVLDQLQLYPEATSWIISTPSTICSTCTAEERIAIIVDEAVLSEDV